jgi:hypothetical protein
MDEYQGLNKVDWKDAFYYLLHQPFYWHIIYDYNTFKIEISKNIIEDISLYPEYLMRTKNSLFEMFHSSNYNHLILSCLYNSSLFDSDLYHSFTNVDDIYREYGNLIRENIDRRYLIIGLSKADKKNFTVTSSSDSKFEFLIRGYYIKPEKLLEMKPRDLLLVEKSDHYLLIIYK